MRVSVGSACQEGEKCWFPTSGVLEPFFWHSFDSTQRESSRRIRSGSETHTHTHAHAAPAPPRCVEFNIIHPTQLILDTSPIVSTTTTTTTSTAP